jgi:decaprenyl-phosphate phosphoribosyltransferase
VLKTGAAGGQRRMIERLRDYITLLRPDQYIKNIFIFLPLFFAQKILDAGPLFETLSAFLIFSILASSIYVFNDYHDVQYDRRHPLKKNRPLASGKVSRKEAKLLMLVLVSVGLTAVVCLLNPYALIVCLVYLALNVTYTLKLKHIAIVDVFVIAMNFVIRIFVGSFTASVPLSIWIIIMTFLLALFMALAKRRDDLLIYFASENKTRRVLDGYTVSYLDSSMMIIASITIVAYIMYTVSHEVIVKFQTDKLYLTAIWVILGIMRYLQITFVEERSGSPTEILLKDRFIQATVCAWILTFGVMIYKLPHVLLDGLANLFRSAGFGG